MLALRGHPGEDTWTVSEGFSGSQLPPRAGQVLAPQAGV